LQDNVISMQVKDCRPVAGFPYLFNGIFRYPFMSWKEKIGKLRHSNWLAGRAVYYSLRPFRLLFLFVTNSRFRSEYLAGFKFGGNFHQHSAFTKENRYPIVFAACQRYLRSRTNLSILSFGCSTGDEVETIGMYLPYARVMGVDINEWCIQECKKKYVNSNFSFIMRFSGEFDASGNFDAVFCMAVFQRTENRLSKDNSRSKGFSFEQFEKEVLMLDAKLKPGGLFIIDHADFSFTDAVPPGSYRPLDFENNRLKRKRPLFDRNNRKIADMQNNYRVFVKS
jgi:methyltransferase family protein